MRLKYCYVDLSFDDMAFLTKPHIEFGVSHRPWLDFEEHINYYRMQGTMFLERNHLFNSADYGVGFFALLGGEMDKNYQDNVNKKYPGKYGSVSVGIYNGGGYHAVEKNTNKILETRLTVRPLPDAFPGLQVSYLGIGGKGNLKTEPDWKLDALCLTCEHRYCVTAGTYYTGDGNFKGTAFDYSGNVLEQNGYSLFGEIRLPEQKTSILGRYDLFDDIPEIDDFSIKRFLAGIAYHLHDHTKILLDYDISTRDKWSDYRESFGKFTFEFHF